ncbi:hypothetical protein SAMN05661080_02828 [Modestobacter sp. DSM 44400]|uniref:hypothetical protein n=1 Tax=Modestobacter sp. DSM 44400 TaxID=1550230 RepID=UPI00089563EF|nr:hypothetical protein [Modestobacter sp. DSM 44400]SDY24968.1 hypothetical protein SAMN05661080_02828 [Modestobacter sp. DSM 44400]
MLLWPTVSALGFLILAGLVIALGTSSTARYEFERNRAQGQRQRLFVPDPDGALAITAESTAAPAAGDQSRPLGGPATPDQSAPGEAVAGHARERQGASGNVATLPQAHPAGQRVDGPSAPAWWLVTEGDNRAIAGPFADRVEADWAGLAGTAGASAHAVHGVRRPDGGVTRRQTPEDRAWLTELGDQIDRLPEDWDEGLTDDDPTATLVVEVATALVEAGLPLHHCAGEGVAGGVCLTPEAGCAGVLISWHQHDRMSHDQVRGTGMVTAVQRTMNAAVAECLEQLGFLVAPFDSSGCSLVIDARTWW